MKATFDIGTEPILQDSVAFSPAKNSKIISPGNSFENIEKSLHHSYLSSLIDLSPILVKEKIKAIILLTLFCKTAWHFLLQKKIVIYTSNFSAKIYIVAKITEFCQYS